MKDEEPWNRVSELAKDLISKLMAFNPFNRISLQSAEKHEWFKVTNIQENSKK